MNQIFRLKDILYGVKKHLSVIIGTTVAGLMIGIVIFVVQSLSASNEVAYQIFASFSISTVNGNGIFINGTDSPSFADFDLAPNLLSPVTYICRSEKVCAQVVENLNLMGVTTKSIQRALALTPYDEKSSIMEITLLWKNEAEGIRIMEEVLRLLPTAVREVLNIGEIMLIEGPVTATITAQAGAKVIFLLTGLGFFLGMLYCFSQLYMHPTLIETKDVGDLLGLKLLEEVRDEPTFEDVMNDNLITNRASLPSAMRESYIALAHILLHQVEEESFAMFVTSSIRGEGKSTVVANLGCELAALDKRVLLIDFDLSSPSLGGFFLDDIDYMHTVNAVYFDDASVQQAIIPITNNLFLLPARLDKRHMGIDRFAKKLVAQMESAYDIILMDTAPVGETSEALYFSNVSNNALFVIRYDFAPCDVIEDSLEKLSKTSANVLGAVVNQVPHVKILDFRSHDAQGRVPAKRAKKKLSTAADDELRFSGSLDLPEDFNLDDDLKDVIPLPLKADEKAPERRKIPQQQDDSDDERLDIVSAAPVPARENAAQPSASRKAEPESARAARASATQPDVLDDWEADSWDRAEPNDGDAWNEDHWDKAEQHGGDMWDEDPDIDLSAQKGDDGP